jgi:hypothetical protein
MNNKDKVNLFMEDFGFTNKPFKILEKISKLGYNVKISSFTVEGNINYYCGIINDKGEYIIEQFTNKNFKKTIWKVIYSFIDYYFKEEDSIVPTMSFSMNRKFNLNKQYNEIYSK